jgi:hypothetical protein
VSEELRAEMDKLSEVNWSEISRNAISEYIAHRKNPHPSIELDLREIRLDPYHPSGYPTLTATLRIHNKMSVDIVVDRTVYQVRFRSRQTEREYRAGCGFDLNFVSIKANSIGQAQLFLPLFREKFEELDGNFSSTFKCTFSCYVTVKSFKEVYRQDVTAEIPIDKWMEFSNRALKKNKTT